MSSPTFFILFICNLVAWSAGSGLAPILPIYASNLGVKHTAIGLSLSIVCFALVVGSLAGGWLAGCRSSPRSILVASGLGTAVAFWSMGLSHGPLTFFSAACAAWFLLGIQMCVVKISINELSRRDAKGFSFGLIASSAGLGSLIGALFTGAVAQTYGVHAMLRALAILFLLSPLLSLGLNLRFSTRSLRTTSSRAPILSSRLLIFLILNSCAYLAGYADRLNTPLLMQSAGFNIARITAATAFGGLVSIPFSIFVGALADRIGRKGLVIFFYSGVAAATVILSYAHSLTQFYASAIIVSIFFYTGNGVIVAYSSEFMVPVTRARDMSVVEASLWAAGVFGYALTGIVMQLVGGIATCLTFAALPLIAAIFLHRLAAIPLNTERP